MSWINFEWSFDTGGEQKYNEFALPYDLRFLCIKITPVSQ